MNGGPGSANGDRESIPNGTPPADPQEVTQLLADWSHGDRAGLGNGDHYDVKINFELNTDRARE